MPVRIAWIGAGPVQGGGVGGVAHLLIRGLLKRGHEVDCYLSGSETSLPADLRSDVRFGTFTAGTWWAWDQWYSRTQITAFATGLGARALAQAQLSRRLREHHDQRPYDIIYQFSNIEMFGLQRHLRKLPPVIMHPETHLAGELRSFVQERRLRRQCEPVWRSAIVGSVLRMRARVQRRHIKHAALVICISRSFQRLLVNDYELDVERSVVVPNPVDLDRFGPISRTQGRPPAIVFISRISVRKGVDQIVSLSHRLADLEGEAELHLVGGHTLWSDYRPLLSSLNPALSKVVGPVAPEDVVRRLHESAILVQPSMYEPFGLTVAEALASGTPVVLTEAVGAGDFVSGPAVAIVPTGDLEALECAVRMMLERVEERGQSLCEDARREAAAAFSADAVISQLEGALAMALDGYGQDSYD